MIKTTSAIISGQDSSYLAELMLSKNYTVHGILKKNNPDRLHNISHILPYITIHEGDITDHDFMNKTISEKRNKRRIKTLIMDTGS